MIIRLKITRKKNEEMSSDHYLNVDLMSWNIQYISDKDRNRVHPLCGREYLKLAIFNWSYNMC